MKKHLSTHLIYILFVCFPLISLSQTISESSDFPGTGNGSLYTLNSTSMTISGTLETPNDGQDRFRINVPAGYEITNVQFTVSDPQNYSYNGFIQFGTGNQPALASSGTINAGAPYTSGTYNCMAVANYAVGIIWTMNITAQQVSSCVEPTIPSVTPSLSSVCEESDVNLSISGALNDATKWYIYSGSCDGTLVGSTSSNIFTVTQPLGNTIYYVRGEGGCATPGPCGSIQLTGLPEDDPRFEYSSETYCRSETNPNPSILGETGGTFSSSSSNLILNPQTGEVNLKQSIPGTYTITYTTNGTCSSYLSESIEILATSESTDTQVACDEYVWINNQTYTSSNNTDSVILTNVNNCDSVVYLDLTINSSNSSTDTQVACDEYVWINNQTYTSSNNTDSVILTNVNNCDSVVYLDLTINSSNSSTDTQVACDEYVWINNQTYTSSNNTDSVILTNVNNCDSVVYLDLTINLSNSSTDTVKIVDEYTWIDGVTYTESNNTAFYVDTNVFGCDSTIYLNLEIVDYCPSRSTRNRFEWIQAIEIGGLSNTSGSNSGGYGNYLSENLNVDTNEVVNLSLTPGYKRRQYVEFWSIWVDWNFDGEFSDMNELVFRKSGKGVQSGSFTVPVNVDTNDLRMRVSMRWRRNAPSCNNFSGGEVEDYLISVNGAQGFIESSQQGKYAAETITTEFVSEFVEVYPNPISKNRPVSIIVRVSESSEEMIVVSDIVGKTVFTKAINVLEGENEISISNLNLKPGMYFIGFQNQMESYKIIVTE